MNWMSNKLLLKEIRLPSIAHLGQQFLAFTVTDYMFSSYNCRCIENVEGGSAETKSYYNDHNCMVLQATYRGKDGCKFWFIPEEQG